MANEFVLGKNVQLRAKQGGSYIPFACADSCSITVDTELIPATTATSGKFRKYRPRYTEWSLSLSGLTYIQNSDGDYMYVFDLITEQLRNNGLDIELLFVDEQNRMLTLRGYVYIPTTTINNDVEDFSDWETELQGSGQFTMADYIPPTNANDVKAINYTGDGGETSYTDIDLIGRVLLEWSRDGVAYEIITSGEPSAKQVKYNSATGTISWVDPLFEGEWLHGLYK